MSRKDYELMADIIRAQLELPSNVDRTAMWCVADTFATCAKRDNPAFDRTRFLTACGLE